MFLLGFIKMFIYIAIILGAVCVLNEGKHWYRRLIIVVPVTFVLLLIVENLFD